MKERTEILLVEDDVNFGSVLKSFLEMHNYIVTLCDNGEKGYSAFRKNGFHTVLLDVMMPYKDGFTLAKEIRRYDENIPIIFITAKGMKEDIVTGFETGADDYITKPFDTEILLHKIRVLLRRNAPNVAEQQPEAENISIGSFTFNHHLRSISGPDGQQTLSPKENELLKMLCISDDNLLERRQALLKIWGEDNYFTARSMDVYITKLRRYLKADETISIINVQRKGFRLVVKQSF